MMTDPVAKNHFHVEVIKPSRYDDDGYVVQWRRAFVPSNSLATVYALAEDVKQRQALGADVDVTVRAYDECNSVLPTQKIIERMRQPGQRGVVLLTGVQTNQFPRAADLARQFRQAGIPVIIGGFHVSGCLSMLPEIPEEIAALQRLGVTLFAGEAEGRMAEVLRDAYHGTLQPIYNYLDDLPHLENQVLPVLPPEVARGYFNVVSFDAGRGCPFRCSFCTIINVQGRKSRYRTADDIECLIRKYLCRGTNRFYITDDNMARNRHWEAIFERMIDMREQHGLHFKFYMQVDTMCHKIPGFIDKAARAGCSRVFIGMESVNPDNLKSSLKFQNNIREYRTMLHQWRKHRIITYAGYILGFPADTPASIERDIRTIQRELPIDILEFTLMTPLPGSADHKTMYEQGTWLDPDFNKYDVEHVTVKHPRMTTKEWQHAYDQAWHLYYSEEHVATMMRRAVADGIGAERLGRAVAEFYGWYRAENLHPIQCGLQRRKIRTTRRPTFPREHPLWFYPRRLWEIVKTWGTIGHYYYRLRRLRQQILREANLSNYRDEALTPSASVRPQTPTAQPQLVPLALLSDEVAA